MSSAASCRANRSHRCSLALMFATAMKGSMGQLPAPAPCPAREASTRVTPPSTAATGYLTARCRYRGQGVCDLHAYCAQQRKNQDGTPY